MLIASQEKNYLSKKNRMMLSVPKKTKCHQQAQYKLLSGSKPKPEWIGQIYLEQRAKPSHPCKSSSLLYSSPASYSLHSSSSLSPPAILCHPISNLPTFFLKSSPLFASYSTPQLYLYFISSGSCFLNANAYMSLTSMIYTINLPTCLLLVTQNNPYFNNSFLHQKFITN